MTICIWLAPLLGSPAFSDGEGVTDGSVSEAGREVDRDVLVPLLEPEHEKAEQCSVNIERDENYKEDVESKFTPGKGDHMKVNQ